MPQSKQKLYQNVHYFMRYWYGRIILGLGGRATLAWLNGVTVKVRQVQCNASRRRAYWRLREQGLNYYEAKAKLDGTTPEIIRARSKRTKQAYRAKWGGFPEPNTRAWVRREIARTAWA